MPINLNDVAASAVSSNVKKVDKKYKPTNLNACLTGTGGKIGLLNEMSNPSELAAPSTIRPGVIFPKSYTNGNIQVKYIPCTWIDEAALLYIDSIPLPPNAEYVGTCAAAPTSKVYIVMAVNDIKLDEVNQGKALPKKKILDVNYRMYVYVQGDASDSNYKVLSAMPDGQYMSIAKSNSVYTVITNDPAAFIQDVIHNNLGDPALVDQFFNDYVLYEGVAGAIERIMEHTAEDFIHFLNCGNIGTSTLVRMLRAMEKFNIPLSEYSTITNAIHACANNSSRDIDSMLRANMNIMIMSTLEDLRNSKSQLSKIPSNGVTVGTPYSKNQIAAITTTDSLSLVQSGAGTGKSTVILGRVDYMTKSGIDPQDILVLSFTNAAADNIKEKNPKVKSMTIASMVHTIYNTTFPSHQLSTITTLCNTMDIAFKGTSHHGLAKELKDLLRKIESGDNQSFTHTMNLVEDNYDEIIDMLDAIEQTTLELEIIIASLGIDTMLITPAVACKHIIIDEVQDNSIFEFIYLLNYVISKKTSLFMVGDCSQTLYEFRMSNPKALNSLESSGVFSTYKLDINYRSNQEILDFANLTLADIEANQYANIQLKSNSLSSVTLQSFTDAVNLEYRHVIKKSDMEEGLPAVFAGDVKKYIDDKLAAGEQVALLAFNRRMVHKIEDTLKIMYPNANIANLVPQVAYDITFFSSYIRDKWDEVKFMPQSHILSVVSSCIMNYYSHIVGANQAKIDAAKNAVSDFCAKYYTLVTQWHGLVSSGAMTQDECLEKLKTLMLSYEIEKNAARRRVVSAKNDANKEAMDTANANFVLSTIHSVKGLEFDNVVLMYDANNNMAEDKKRLYYVALTRAKKSEYILAYDTSAHPLIVENYNAIVAGLSPAGSQNISVAIGG